MVKLILNFIPESIRQAGTLEQNNSMMYYKFTIIFVCCFLSFSTANDTTDGGDLILKESDSERIEQRLGRCQHMTASYCKEQNKSKTYLSCWYQIMTRCMSVSAQRNSGDECEDTEMTHSFYVCWHGSCVTVEFTFTECVVHK